MSTDIDSVALDKAKEGIYSKKSLKNVKPEWLKKYFTPVEGTPEKFQICDEIKRMVMFRKHNFITDKIFKRMDIIFCRNVVIYFTRATKEIVMENFYNSLNYQGYFVNGKSEVLFLEKKGYVFYTVDSQENIYCKERRSRYQDYYPEHLDRRGKGRL